MTKDLPAGAEPMAKEQAVSAYKKVLQRVVDNRPSGTRHRLAHALGKNRSFISQITSPVYSVPIPAQHLEKIFEVCHFTAEDRREFMAAYAAAHPRRLTLVKAAGQTRTLSVEVPDLGDARRNRQLDDMMADVARRIARLLEDL